MVSAFMPDVVVEIAFDSGYTTPAASRTWTDVSTYVELADRIAISVGRQDERSTADANSLSLTLDNTDGRFTAGRAGSPYYPNVKIGRPIRVKVTPPGGSTVTRFVGFVDEWPVEWNGSDAYAKATIRATSRLARLGLSTKLRSMIENEILLPRPHRYWTLGDAAGSTTAVELSGQAALRTGSSGTAVTFGNAVGPGTDGLTAVEFGATSARLETLDTLELPAGPRSVRCWILVSTTPDSGGSGARIASGAGLDIYVTSAGVVEGIGTTGTAIADGSGHDVVLVRDGVDEILYVDGVEVDSVASAAPSAATSMQFSFTDPEVATSGSGVMAHVAVYDVALTAAQVAAQAEALLSGGAGDRTDERLLRILKWGGVAATEVDAETGVETMTYQVTSGQSVVDALRDVESTEGGVLFDGTDGDVKFHNRSHRYLSASVATLNMASQHVESDFAPKLDRSTLVNDATVENPTTGESARSVDTTSSDEYGIATTSAKSVADSYDPLAQKAAWLVASYAEPRNRVPSLTVDVLAHQGLTPSAQTLLGVTVGDMITVEDQPLQAPFPGGDWILGGGELGEVILGDAPSGHLFVEGYTETIGPESYSLTFNLSPTYPTLNTIVLNDPIRGELDAGYVLAY